MKPDDVSWWELPIAGWFVILAALLVLGLAMRLLVFAWWLSGWVLRALARGVGRLLGGVDPAPAPVEHVVATYDRPKLLP
jgi:hypothetical protein